MARKKTFKGFLKGGGSVKISVSNNMAQNTKRLEDAYTQQALRYIDRISNRFKLAVIESMQPPKSGREYERGGEIHIASAPGEPPAIDEGTLKRSLTVRNATMINGNPSGSLETDLAYGTRLELIRDRKFMGKGSPANKFIRIFAKATSKSLSVKNRFKPIISGFK